MTNLIYVLPTMLTFANAGLGFYAIVQTFSCNFQTASWAILAAVLMDVLDGFIARATKTVSRFGAEIDSLADMVSFGIAPALLVYNLFLVKHGRLGFILCLFYLLASLIRLARFNIRNMGVEGRKINIYRGLTTLVAAGILASMVILYEMYNLGVTKRSIPVVMSTVPFFSHIMPIILFLLSILMVSEIKFINLKELKFNRPKPLRILLPLVCLILLIYAYPQNIIFILFFVYIVSGLGAYLVHLVQLMLRNLNGGRNKTH